MVLIFSASRSSPSAAIFSGVSATANSAGVALFTPASVACADSTTATSRVKGLMYWSSPFGSGLAAASRSKIASVLAASRPVTLFAPSASYRGAERTRQARVRLKRKLPCAIALSIMPAGSLAARRRRNFEIGRNAMKSLNRTLRLAAALSASLAAGAAQAASDKVVIGDIDDMSGPYADVIGPNGVEAIKMAIADFGG